MSKSYEWSGNNTGNHCQYSTLGNYNQVNYGVTAPTPSRLGLPTIVPVYGSVAYEQDSDDCKNQGCLQYLSLDCAYKTSNCGSIQNNCRNNCG